MVKPDKSVLHVVLFIYTNSDITALIRRASPIACVSPIPHHISGILGESLLWPGLPIQMASFVGKEASEFIFAYQTLG